MHNPIVTMGHIEEFDIKKNIKSLHSLLRNRHLVHLKKATCHVCKMIHQHLCDFSNGKSMIEIAKELNYPLYMLARLIVESVCKNGKKVIVEAKRNPIITLEHIEEFDIKKEYRDQLNNHSKSNPDHARTDPFLLISTRETCMHCV